MQFYHSQVRKSEVPLSAKERALERYLSSLPPNQETRRTVQEAQKKSRAQRRRERKAAREAEKTVVEKFLDNLFSMRAGQALFRWASIAMFIIALFIGYEDYLTSVLGYGLIPTAKATPIIGYLVGALPQVGQIVMFNQYRKKRDGLAGLVGLSFFIADIVTDVYFKTSGSIQYLIPAIMESFLIFTVFSEVILIYSWEGVLEALKSWKILK